jgi:hypothetical protein
MHLHLTLPSEPDRPSSGEGIARRAYYGSIEILCDVASTIRARRAPPLSRSVLYACRWQRSWRKCCTPPGSVEIGKRQVIRRVHLLPLCQCGSHLHGSRAGARSATGMAACSTTWARSRSRSRSCGPAGSWPLASGAGTGGPALLGKRRAAGRRPSPSGRRPCNEFPDAPRGGPVSRQATTGLHGRSGAKGRGIRATRSRPSEQVRPIDARTVEVVW